MADVKYAVRIEKLEITITSNEKVINCSKIRIPYGRTVIIEGVNGAGKSTLLNVIAGQGGYCTTNKDKEVYVYEKNFSEYDPAELRRKIVYINQEEEFLSNESAFKYLVRSAKTAASDFENKKELISEIKKMAYNYYSDIIYKFYVNEIKDPKKAEMYRKNPKMDCQFMYFKNAYKLSGGQRKILHLLSGVIKAKVAGCKLVLMDEPLNNLDKENKQLLINILNDLRDKNSEITILLITHCRIFPGIKDKITIQEKEKINTAKYESLEKELNCLDCLTK